MNFHTKRISVNISISLAAHSPPTETLQMKNKLHLVISCTLLVTRQTERGVEIIMSNKYHIPDGADVNLLASLPKEPFS